MVLYALEKEKDKKLYQAWVSLYPKMDKESFISFEDFKEKQTSSKKFTEISDEQIEKEMMKVVNAYESR